MKKQSNRIEDYHDASLLFPSRYIKSAEIAAAGRPIPLTIKRIEPRHELKSSGGKTELKPVVFFAETEKGVVLNKTNAGRLVEVLGKDPRKWLGGRVVFCVERVDGFGKMTDAIRVDVDASRDANRNKRAEPEREPGIDDFDEAQLAAAAYEAERGVQ